MLRQRQVLSKMKEGWTLRTLNARHYSRTTYLVKDGVLNPVRVSWSAVKCLEASGKVTPVASGADLTWRLTNA